MNYEDIARDLVDRTRQNLQATRNLPPSGDAPFYEVTHLINSLLGLIVVPNERMQSWLPTTTFDDLQAGGWGLDVASGRESGPSDLPALIHGMRNAVAHARLDFRANEATRGIELVELSNTYPDGRVRWSVRFTPSGLRSFRDRPRRPSQTRSSSTAPCGRDRPTSAASRG